MHKKSVSDETLIYKNPLHSVEERVADLLGRMSIREKCFQLRLDAGYAKLFPPEDGRDKTIAERYGEGYGGFYETDVHSVELFNAIQKHLMEETRLGIPAILMGESLHGCKSNGATVFPQAVGMGATWNTELMEEVATVIGHEARALGIRETFAPNLDISRDPRWGRVEENYGEDPYLTARMGVAYIKGLQSQGVAACPKHYVAHGVPEGGINIAPVHAGERELREIHLPAFAAAVREGGVMSIMPAYSELDGIPLHASRFLLTDVLRGELGFEGFVISDWGAIGMLTSKHFTAETPLEAGWQALWAGVDMEAPERFGFGDNLIEAVESGEVPEKWIDLAVERILRVKFWLGLFEEPYIDPEGVKKLCSPAAVALARRVGRELQVLLKNEGSLLPLSNDIGRVAVIGPNAAFAQLGDYSPREASERAVTVLQGLRERLGEDRVTYAPGCSIAGGDDDDIAEAVEVAAQSDAVVLVLGDNSCFHGGVGWGDSGAPGKVAVTCGEGFDVSDLDLPGRQQKLMEAVAACGKPVVLVMMSGRPYAIRWAAENIPAILQAWYPGQEGGHAVADVLFGDHNPSGRLPISFPRSAGNLPCYYNHKVSARGFYKKPGRPESPGRDYVFSTPEPLYPFGHGLSYTVFEYSDLQIDPPIIAAQDEVRVSVMVRNSGKVAGSEVVQLYLRDCFSRTTPFVKRLRRFTKIELAPGDQKKVNFTLSEDDFSFINEKMQPEIEPGEFEVQIGTLSGRFRIK